MVTWLAHVGAICHEQATHEQGWSKKKKLGGPREGHFLAGAGTPANPPSLCHCA